MKKIAMIYFSNTGNTEAMANIVADSAKEEGADFQMLPASEASADEMLEADVIVMGGPASGTEELDQDYIEPLMEAMEGKLAGKKVALFGSYGWGGGQFMETWVERIEESGGQVIGQVVGEEGPDEVEEDLRELGQTIAQA